jgi:hypothetical protein
MSTIGFMETMNATPQQPVAGPSDFGPDRSKLFPNSTDECLKVHDHGPTHAKVTEDSRPVRQRPHNDWSDPKRVVLTTRALDPRSSRRHRS